MRYTCVEYPWHHSHGQTQIYVSAIHGHMNDLTPPPFNSSNRYTMHNFTYGTSELKLLNRVVLYIYFSAYVFNCIVYGVLSYYFDRIEYDFYT